VDLKEDYLEQNVDFTGEFEERKMLSIKNISKILDDDIEVANRNDKDE